MKISTYNPTDMSLLLDDVTGVNFGNVIKGQHNSAPIVIRPSATIEGSFTQLALFLEDKAGFDHSAFGKFKSAVAINGITAGSNYLSDNFNEASGIVDFTNFSSVSGDGLVFNASSPEYAWMDVQVGLTETLGTGTLNYRFVFEYS